ncbi:c-type cytochrome [Novosphingobium olei]|uniref:C-type cytochrome n=1 Tax=Novosphingobium olei TaxID=2728851 RepID=A0A7Y0BQL5_9SPHN|nr:c-type cytochrome [Novosphingobium olei]NML94694.1 c-type cytochrome [Novosphingobium olei]BEV02317.1 c-type cytochrome [Novosphingobium olei]
MPKPVHACLAFALPLALAACGAKTDDGTAAQAGAETTVADAAPAAFGICKSCHAVEKGKTVIGPSLYGIVGTKAGDVAGYSFSPALKGSGLVWDEATLDKWLENPMKLVPGTRMSYAGQADPEKRKAIIAYLKTLK